MSIVELEAEIKRLNERVALLEQTLYRRHGRTKRPRRSRRMLVRAVERQRKLAEKGANEGFDSVEVIRRFRELK